MRHMSRALALVGFLFVAACGGGGGGGSPSTSGPSGGGGGPPPPTLASPGTRVEETSATVTFSGAWTTSDSKWGWSGGSAKQASAAGATVTVAFEGTSIRWLGARGRGMGLANVSVDGGTPREVNL